MTVERLFDLPPRTPREAILPEFETVKSRLIDAFNNATDEERVEGANWYESAHLHCVELATKYCHLGLKSSHIAGIIATLSPLKSWEQNLAQAEELLKTGTTKGLGHAIESAKLILHGFDPMTVVDRTGENYKVQAFFRNIAYPQTSQEVTLDRHMWTLIFGDLRAVKKAHLYFRKQEYYTAEEYVQKIAAEIGCLPHQLQATVWLVQRRLSSGKVKPQVYITQGVLDFES